MMPRARTVFIGVKRVGESALKILLACDTPVVAVITMNGDDNAGIVALAKKANIPIFQAPDMKSPEFLKTIAALKPQRGLMFSFPKILKKSFLDLFEMGCFNFHPARLPEYRGCYPTIWPILNDDKVAQCTMHVVDEGIDTGEIIDTWDVSVLPDETGYSLYEKMIEVIPRLLGKHLPKILLEQPIGIKQDESRANYFFKKLPHEAKIDWNWGAVKIDRFVRALYHPIFLGAYTDVDGKKFEVLAIKEAKHLRGIEQRPGTFISKDEDLFIACGEGYIQVVMTRDVDGSLLKERIGFYFEKNFCELKEESK